MFAYDSLRCKIREGIRGLCSVKKLSILSGLLVLSLSLTLFGCGTSNTADSAKSNSEGQSQEIIVSAAASLTDSLTELQTMYNQKNPKVKLTFNFGGSGTLQQQIENGAPADLFISAGKSQVDTLVGKNLLNKDSITNIVGNDLVLVVGKDNTEVNSIQDLTKAGVEKISIGTPETVPAGKYAQESLTNLKLWDTVQPKLVLAKDVTSVLNYVETGNAEAGFVYKSDALGSTKVKVAATVPAETHKAILYPAGVVTASKNQQEAQDFLKFLQSPEAQRVFEKYGFSIPQK